MLSLRPDVSSARRLLKDLQTREIPRVVGRTLNRTAKSVRSHASQEMRKRINLKKATLDQAITTKRSNEIQNLSMLNKERAWFEIRYSGKPFGIRDFAARPSKRKGVTYQVTRASGRRVYIRAGNKGFIVQKFGGHVFTRVGPDPKGSDKAPIKKASGPSIPQFAATRRVQAELIQYARDFWARELERNIRFAISRRK